MGACKAWLLTEASWLNLIQLKKMLVISILLFLKLDDKRWTMALFFGWLDMSNDSLLQMVNEISNKIILIVQILNIQHPNNFIILHPS